MPDLVAGCFLGALLGLRHALEPDHLAAVSTLVSTETDPLKGALVGAFWGIGHTVALLVICALLGFLQAEMPIVLMNLFELAVALMLVGLGVRSLRRAVRPVLPAVAALHQASRWSMLNRPLGAGLMHGAAGSGALTALVMAGLPSPALRLAYVVLFGVGSMLGMGILTGLFALPMARLLSNRAMVRLLPTISGAVALGVGIQRGHTSLTWLLG